MTTTTPIDAATRKTGTTAAKPPSRGLNEMNQSDFIALMTAQMKNQDPFEPVDNTQMVAQMAQFSSLAGISEMSSTLKAMAAKLGGTTAKDALGYVGRNVLVAGDVAFPRESGGFAGAVELDAAVSDVNLTITDANGRTVRSIALGKQPAGTMTYDWDGTTADGKPAGAGPFTVAVTARDGTKPVVNRPLVWAPVTSVAMPAGGEPVLSVAGLSPVKSSAVRAVG